MSENTAIAWTDATFSGWEGCTPISPGCDNCYAKARNRRFGGGVALNWGSGAPRRRTSVATWRAPHRWNRAHAKFLAEHGRRRRVFCSSLADVFDMRRSGHDLVSGAAGATTSACSSTLPSSL